MRRDPATRYGCDRCKVDQSTYGFTHDDFMKLWICEHCLAVLMDWPEDKRIGGKR